VRNEDHHEASKPNEADAAAEQYGEQLPEPSPRIWVGSLSDYNNGVLYGEWLDAAREPEELHADIQALLAGSPTTAQYGEPAEEWGIFDHEGFGDWHLSEYEDIAVVSRVALGIAEHGQAFAAWAAQCAGDAERLDQFDEAFLGHYDSVPAWAEQIIDDLGYQTAVDAAVPESFRPYVRIDFEQFARDAELGGDICSYKAPHDSIWIFDANN